MGLWYRPAIQICIARLVSGVFLARRFHSRQDSDAHKNNRTGKDPVRRNMHQVRGINQPADQNCESNSVDSK